MGLRGRFRIAMLIVRGESSFDLAEHALLFRVTLVESRVSARNRTRQYERVDHSLHTGGSRRGNLVVEYRIGSRTGVSGYASASSRSSCIDSCRGYRQSTAVKNGGKAAH